MQQDEVIICGECRNWVDGNCLLTGTIGVEPEEMDFGALACEDFAEATDL